MDRLIICMAPAILQTVKSVSCSYESACSLYVSHFFISSINYCYSSLLLADTLKGRAKQAFDNFFVLFFSLLFFFFFSIIYFFNICFIFISSCVKHSNRLNQPATMTMRALHWPVRLSRAVHKYLGRLFDKPTLQWQSVM